MQETPQIRIGIELIETNNIYLDFEGVRGEVYVVADKTGYQELAENDIIDFRSELVDGTYKTITYLYDEVIRTENGYMLVVTAKQTTFTKIYKK